MDVARGTDMWAAISLETLAEELEEDRPADANAYGRRRGECAGVASGVWSGVGERESCENVGDEGAVDCGDDGWERFWEWEGRR